MCGVAEIIYKYPKKHKLSIAEIGDNMGVKESTLERQLNPNDSYGFPITQLIPLIRACKNDYTILDHIERRVGRIAIRMKDTTGNEPLTMKCLGRLAKEAGEAISAVAGAFIDGTITDEKAEKCSEELCELAQQCYAMIIKLRKHRQKHPNEPVTATMISSTR